MSTDTQALFEVADAVRALEVIRECATTTMPDPLRRVSERFAKYWNPKEWEYHAHDNLVGPGGFSIRAKGRIVEAYHLLPYNIFTQQDEDGRRLLSAFYFLCRLVGSHEMLLMHEILPWEGQDLDTICKVLVDKIGPPAKDWAELSRSEYSEPRCWLRLGLDEEAELSLLASLALDEQPDPGPPDPWDVWRGEAESPTPRKADHRPLPKEGKWYLADLLYARPTQASRGCCQQETCCVMVKALSAAGAYTEAFAHGQTHATEAPGEVWFLGVSRLATIVEQRNLVTPEQLADLERVCHDLWPNGVGDQDAV
jgi:hypothetical protein